MKNNSVKIAASIGVGLALALVTIGALSPYRVAETAVNWLGVVAAISVMSSCAVTLGLLVLVAWLADYSCR